MASMAQDQQQSFGISSPSFTRTRDPKSPNKL